MWDSNNWYVSVLRSTRQLVHLSIAWQNTESWNLTAIYGSPQRANRESLWEDLQVIIDDVSGPWCALGDFNAILREDEQEGGQSSIGV